MKQILKPIITLLVLASHCNMAQAELSQEDLALEVAHCYVGHERAQTDIYKTAKAEELKQVIADLIGKTEVNKTILIAKRIQTNSSSNGVSLFIRADKVVAKYCTSLDEKMVIVQNK